jgi:hypothetical protein
MDEMFLFFIFTARFLFTPGLGKYFQDHSCESMKL